MSDREMLAYALIVVAGLVYGIVLIRWWYKMRSPFRPQRSRKSTEYLGTKLTPQTAPSSSKEGAPDDK